MITEHEREEINLMGHILYPNNNYNMNICIQTKLVTAGEEATVHVWLLVT